MKTLVAFCLALAVPAVSVAATAPIEKVAKHPLKNLLKKLRPHK
jgi:hypothetical protein